MLEELLDGDLRIRSWQMTDAPVRLAAAKDAEIRRFTSVPRDIDLADAQQWIHESKAWHENRVATYFAIEWHGQCVGSVGLIAFISEHERAEVGYWLLPHARGQGLAARSLACLINYSFEQPDIARLDLFTNLDNKASMRTAEACGFVREGLLRSFHRLPNGDREDLYLYGLVKP